MSASPTLVGGTSMHPMAGVAATGLQDDVAHPEVVAGIAPRFGVEELGAQVALGATSPSAQSTTPVGGHAALPAGVTPTFPPRASEAAEGTAAQAAGTDRIAELMAYARAPPRTPGPASPTWAAGAPDLALDGSGSLGAVVEPPFVRMASPAGPETAAEPALPFSLALPEEAMPAVLPQRSPRRADAAERQDAAPHEERVAGDAGPPAASDSRFSPRAAASSATTGAGGDPREDSGSAAEAALWSPVAEAAPTEPAAPQVLPTLRPPLVGISGLQMAPDARLAGAALECSVAETSFGSLLLPGIGKGNSSSKLLESSGSVDMDLFIPSADPGPAAAASRQDSGAQSLRKPMPPSIPEDLGPGEASHAGPWPAPEPADGSRQPEQRPAALPAAPQSQAPQQSQASQPQHEALDDGGPDAAPEVESPPHPAAKLGATGSPSFTFMEEAQQEPGPAVSPRVQEPERRPVVSQESTVAAAQRRPAAAAPKAKPKGPAPWSAGGDAKAAAPPELDEEEFMRSDDSEDDHFGLPGRRRPGANLGAKPAQAAQLSEADAPKAAAAKEVSRDDLGFSGLSDSEDHLKASLEAPSDSVEASSAASKGKAKRPNALSGGRGLFGSLKQGLPGGGSGSFGDAPSSSRSGAAALTGSLGGSLSGGLGLGGAKAMGLSALKNKGKPAGGRSLGASASLGGSIDWNMASERW